MDDAIKITVEQGYLLVEITTETIPSFQPDAFARTIEAARNAGVSKILFDFHNLTGQLSTMERFDYGSFIAKQFRGFQVAFIVDQSLRDPNRFGENVAFNRGAYLRVVKTRAEAYEWLNVTPAQAEP